MHLFDLLQKRGLLDQVSDPGLKKALDNPLKFYVGFDPSQDSLHLGNLLPLIVAKWLERYGHTPYLIIGGATGRIGDPSGKSIERPLLQDTVINANVQAIFCFLKEFMSSAHLLNNNDWLEKMPIIEFLRDVGKHFRLGQMLGKESVKARLASSEGMSFTEFSYQILQAYDFTYLFRHYGVVLEIGGSDQWGNITAGIELMRRFTSDTLYGMTFPLLMRSDGKKFGKSEEGAIWLSEQKLSPYQFYQYLVKVPDADVIKMMKMLTFMDLEEIFEWEEKMKKTSYEPNSAQKKFSEEVTRIVHKEKGLEAALRATEGAAPGAKAFLDAKSFAEIAKDMPHFTFDPVGMRYVDLLVKVNLVKSKSEANRLIDNLGAYLNDQKVTDHNYMIQKEDLIDSFLLVGKGKKVKVLISCK